MRIFWISVALLLSYTVQSISASDEPKSAAELRSTLAALETTAAKERTSLTVIKTSGFTGQECKDKQVISVQEANVHYALMRTKVLNAFENKKESWPLRDWLAETLPSSGISEEENLRKCSKGIPVASVGAVDSLWNALRDRVRYITQKPSLVIDLQIVSYPRKDAPFSLKPLRSEENLFEDRTNAKLNGVYRGIYRISMTLDGFKPIELQRINLVDSANDRLDCRFISEGQLGTSSCGLRKGQP